MQVRKLRLRDVKALDQGHTASRWQSRDGNLGSSSLPIFPPLVCQIPGAPWCPGSSSSLHRPPQDWELLGGCSRVCHLRGFPDHLLLSTMGAASLDLSSKMMTRIHPPFPVPRVPAWCRGDPTAPGAGNSDLLSFVQEETEALGGEGDLFKVAQLVMAELGGAGRSSYPRPLKERLLSSPRTLGGEERALQGCLLPGNLSPQ